LNKVYGIACLFSLALLLSDASFATSPEVKTPEQIRQELDQIVAAFNEQARGLDTQDPVSVEQFNAFVANSLTNHWDPQDMAVRLLGIDAYSELSQLEQQQISQRLAMTFHRYAFEVLEEYKQSPMVLMTGLVKDDDAGLWRVKIRAKPRILPALTGDLYLKATSTGWAIVDAGYAGFTYVSLKDGSYRREFERGGVVGMLAWLDEKNADFFADYCAPELAKVMPEAIIALCQSPQ
jgi:ABC-type transporter MlaC component